MIDFTQPLTIFSLAVLLILIIGITALLLTRRLERLLTALALVQGALVLGLALAGHPPDWRLGQPSPTADLALVALLAGSSILLLAAAALMRLRRTHGVLDRQQLQALLYQEIDHVSGRPAAAAPAVERRRGLSLQKKTSVHEISMPMGPRSNFV